MTEAAPAPSLDFDHLPPLDDEELGAAQKCGYSIEEAGAFKQIYTHYDQNFGRGDGRCSIQLVKSMVRALGINMLKDDEERLGAMLVEVDENKDGSTQFPEFLLLINRMQATNFCGMNDAAAERVRAEQIAQEKKAKASERRNSEKAAHRASLLYLQGQQDMFSTLQAHAADIEKDKLANPQNYADDESDDDLELKDGSLGPGLKVYDEKTDGPYRAFYWKHHKTYLDGKRHEWEIATGRRKPSKTSSKIRA